MTETTDPTRSDLFSRTLRGEAWISISCVVLVTVAFMRMILLGRILDPREIDIFIMATIFIDVLVWFLVRDIFMVIQKKPL
jgi:hypothetical protein